MERCGEADVRRSAHATRRHARADLEGRLGEVHAGATAPRKHNKRRRRSRIIPHAFRNVPQSGRVSGRGVAGGPVSSWVCRVVELGTADAGYRAAGAECIDAGDTCCRGRS